MISTTTSAPERLALALALVLLRAVPTGAATLTLGQSYPIAEPDVLSEIQARAAQVDWADALDKDPGTWGALGDAVTLPLATEATRYRLDLSYTLPFDVPDDQGETLYPAGYTFNPLGYLTLPVRIGVINDHPAVLAWAKAHDADDLLWLLAGGDPLAAGRALGKPVYLLTPALHRRLAFRAVPAIGQQQGTHFEVDQYVVDAP